MLLSNFTETGSRLFPTRHCRISASRSCIALLLASHKAELTDESVADEVFHLTAALKYCGFRGVIGVMVVMDWDLLRAGVLRDDSGAL
jgi:hypothetical protein